jgi:hypothetical protein
MAFKTCDFDSSIKSIKPSSIGLLQLATVLNKATTSGTDNKELANGFWNPQSIESG